MKKFILILYIIMIFSFEFLAGCKPAPDNVAKPLSNLSWNDAMKIQMARYGEKSHKELQPYFAKVNVHFPPAALGLLIFKDTKQMEIWAKDNPKGAWTYIHSFPIFGASGHLGPKLHEGDHQVPEGVYHIVALNPESHFDLSMQLDYPNKFDATEARLENRNNLGGNIFIHGSNLSVGCIAIGNASIETIFPLVYQVGIRNIEVIIAPDDFRKKTPPLTAQANDPKWEPELYHQISQELTQFQVAEN